MGMPGDLNKGSSDAMNSRSPTRMIPRYPAKDGVAITGRPEKVLPEGL